MPRVDGAVVRSAGPADVEALAGISGRALNATYRGVVPDVVLDEWIEGGPTSWRVVFENRASDSPNRAWVAERDGSVLGYATTVPARSHWLPPPDGAGELTNLYLDPDAIGTGLGRLLYEHAATDLRQRGFDPLLVWAFRDNPLATRFYERMGLTMDVAEHSWVLGDVPCPIVRFRRDWPTDGPA
ncbi:GNAT family N-acetyltransferase [soil metagenome]